MLDLFESGGDLPERGGGRAELRLQRGDRLVASCVGDSAVSLRVVGILSEAATARRSGVMDIASAQWSFERIGRLNRIDLRLRPGVDVDALRDRPRTRLPAGIVALAPQVERDRAVTLTRAYRVNLNMLALVALLDRRLPGVLHAVAVGAAPAQIARRCCALSA